MNMSIIISYLFCYLSGCNVAVEDVHAFGKLLAYNVVYRRDFHPYINADIYFYETNLDCV